MNRNRLTLYEDSSRYLYLRTRLNLAHQASLVTGLIRELGCAADLLLPSTGPLWLNGIVVRFYIPQSPENLAEYLKEHLGAFSTWAVHDGRDLACEPYGGGPVCLHYNESRRFAEPMAQVFIQYHDGERDQDAVKDAIKSVLGPTARSVFFFENGCIFMMPTVQPAGLIIRRFERIRKRLKTVVVCNQADHETRAFPATSSQCWKTLPVRAFEPEDEDDCDDEAPDSSIETVASGSE